MTDLKPAPNALDEAPPYVGVGSTVTPQYTGEDVRKNLNHGGHVRWRDLPQEERDRRSVITCIVQTWNQYSRLPTVDKISTYKKIDTQAVLGALENPQTIADLITLGVIPDNCQSWEQAVSGGEAGLTTKQVNAVRQYYSLVHNPRTLAAALEEIDVTVQQWDGWMGDPVFAGYVRDLGSRLFGDKQGEIDMALIREAVSGDVPAIKLSMELTGRIKQDKNAVDAGMLMARVLEVISRHCDPATQTQIATELAAIAGAMRGGQPMAALPRVIDQTGHAL